MGSRVGASRVINNFRKCNGRMENGERTSSEGSWVGVSKHE